MITSTQVIPLLLEACPSFERVWQEHCAKYGDEFLIYIALGDFARHLLHLQQQGQLECFESVVRVIERLHVEGDDYVREAATIGLLEAIQNYWLHGNLDLEQFETRLLPESRKWWDELTGFWRGERAFVGEGIQRQQMTHRNQ